MKDRAYAANYPRQLLYTFVAASQLLGVHATSLHRWAKEGRLKTVDTPVGRRISRDEIERMAGITGTAI